jgi:hypothetical protein
VRVDVRLGVRVDVRASGWSACSAAHIIFIRLAFGGGATAQAGLVSAMAVMAVVSLVSNVSECPAGSVLGAVPHRYSGLVTDRSTVR